MLYSRMVHQSTTLLHQCRQSALPVGCPLPMDPWWELYLCLVISKIGSTCSSQDHPRTPQRLHDSHSYTGHLIAIAHDMAAGIAMSDSTMAEMIMTLMREQPSLHGPWSMYRT